MKGTARSFLGVYLCSSTKKTPLVIAGVVTSDDIYVVASSLISRLLFVVLAGMDEQSMGIYGTAPPRSASSSSSASPPVVGVMGGGLGGPGMAQHQAMLVVPQPINVSKMQAGPQPPASVVTTANGTGVARKYTCKICPTVRAPCCMLHALLDKCSFPRTGEIPARLHQDSPSVSLSLSRCANFFFQNFWTFFEKNVRVIDFTTVDDN